MCGVYVCAMCILCCLCKEGRKVRAPFFSSAVGRVQLGVVSGASAFFSLGFSFLSFCFCFASSSSLWCFFESPFFGSLSLCFLLSGSSELAFLHPSLLLPSFEPPSEGFLRLFFLGLSVSGEGALVVGVAALLEVAGASFTGVNFDLAAKKEATAALGEVTDGRG